jgi:hypothetical protein
VLVANPDGYQYTFDAERLWRKNYLGGYLAVDRHFAVDWARYDRTNQPQ